MNELEKNYRKIRSFVIREGRMTKSQRQALDNYWDKYGLSSATGLLNFEETFARKAPVVLEIGFGMGHSLVAMAQAQPEIDFIGIEVHRPGVGALLASLATESIENVRVYCEDALEVLRRSIPDNSLTRLQLFFPDPWPKKKHHKRRIVQPDFVELVISKLVPGGTFHVATDWQNYAEHILTVVEANNKLVNQAGQGQFAAKPDYRPETKFERRGQRLGHGVWDVIFAKV